MATSGRPLSAMTMCREVLVLEIEMKVESYFLSFGRAFELVVANSSLLKKDVTRS